MLDIPDTMDPSPFSVGGSTLLSSAARAWAVSVNVKVTIRVEITSHAHGLIPKRNLEANPNACPCRHECACASLFGDPPRHWRAGVVLSWKCSGHTSVVTSLRWWRPLLSPERSLHTA